MKAFNLSEISDNIFNDARNLQIKFNNGDELFISSRNFYGFDLHILRAIVVDDPVIDKAYQFDSGYIDVDKAFLKRVIGDSIIDNLVNKGAIVSLKIECNDEFTIANDYPFMICNFDERSHNDFRFEETADSIVFRWEPIQTN